MKKLYVLLLAACGLNTQLNAQCGPGIPDLTCTVSPAYPHTCPSVLPDGMAGQAYQTDITMWFPQQFYEPSAGLTVTINSVEINAVSGMPFGFNYTATPTTVIPSQNEFEAIRICGTPFNAGDYTVTISITVYAQAFGISQTVNQNVPLALHIAPSSQGNVAFTINNPSGCTPLASSFVTNFPSNGNAGYSYFWDLGNGFSTSQETVPPVNYVANGPSDSSYIIQHSVTIDTVGYYLTNVQVTNVSCTDNPGNNPDIYLKIFNGQGQQVFNNSGSTIEGTPPYSFNLNLHLTNPPYKIQVWDGDGGLLGADDNCADGSEGSTAGINMPLPTTDGISTQIGTTGGLILNYTINHPVIQITGTDTIQVSPNPVIPVITGLPGFDFCENTKTQLLSTLAYQYQWYKADTLLANETLQNYYAGFPGHYLVQVTNTYGCSATSDTVLVHRLPAPPIPAISFSGGVLNTDLNPATYQLQWFYEGFSFAGQTAQTCTPLFDGTYFVRAENEFGCYSYSDTLDITKTGIYTDNAQELKINMMPNPANGQLTVYVDGNTTGPVTLAVYSITGAQMLGKQLNIDKGVVSKYNEMIDISNLPAGVYTVSFKYGDKQKVLKLLVI